MKKTLFGLGCALALTLAHGETHLPGAAEVRALGRLNGEALACKQMALVDRVRAHIVGIAPKTREVGEMFEAATTEGFIAMGKDGAACQDGRTLAERIETATRDLRAAFAADKK